MAKTHMRYRLAHSREIKKNRWNNVCPSCGCRGKFSPYIDTVTNQPIAAKECGRCCREKSCAYHMPPSEWFKEHPTDKREWLPREQYVELMRQRRREAEQAKEQTKENCRPLRGTSEAEQREAERRGDEVEKYYKRMSILCHKSRSDKNLLARWLCTLFPKDQVAEVLARYRTGSTRDGRIIYWQIDECGQVHAGKVMAYDPCTGHRVKEGKEASPPALSQGEGACRHRGKPAVCWVHSIKIDGIRFDEMLAPQCLFGLHLAPLLSPQGGMMQSSRSQSSPLGGTEGGQGREAALVESEKTALIMSLIKPDTVWLATGGKANFKESMLWPLLGHEIAVYPDADALRDWELRIHQLNSELGHRLYIPTGYYNLMDHEEPRSKGWDLVDVILSEELRVKGWAPRCTHS